VIKKQGPGSKTFWGEHLFFNTKFTEREDLERSDFRIQVLDHNSILPNDMIGKTGGSVTQIYSQTNHSLINKWSILTNPQKSFKETMGFLQYSVSFLRASDPFTNLE